MGTRAESSTPTSTNTAKKSKKCGFCKATVKSGDRGLLCEYCGLWFHDTCEGVDHDKYEAIASSGEQTHWFCKACNLKVMDTLRFIQNVKDENEALKVEIATIKTQVTDMASNFESAIKTKPSYKEVDEMIDGKLSKLETSRDGDMINIVLSEIEQRSRRVNNIVIHGVSESTSENREERISYDKQVIKDIFKTCEVKNDDSHITKAVRVGAFDKEKMKRPIIATLSKPEIKGELFRNAVKLNDSSHKDVRIGNDLTKTERENEKKLHEKAKQMQAETGDQFKVRGPPWARKIILVPQAEGAIK